MSFTLYMQKVTEKAGANADNIVKKIAIDVLSSVVNKSPVDTGRFRGNWQTGIGQVDSNTESPNDKSGASAISKASLELTGFKAGKTIYISNSLPYAQRLENGWSKQAPQGMVRLTVIAFRRIIKKASL
jgi:hypothetical protein